MMRYYTYAHYKPDGGLFYIGKGSEKTNRAYSFKDRNPFWAAVVNKHGNPDVEILAYWDLEQDALDHEKLLISCFRDMGFVLANVTDGGDGISGFKHTEETKLKVSIGNKGRKRTLEVKEKLRLIWLGRKHTKETLAKMSIAQKGNTNGKGRLGLKQSEATKLKISEANSGLKRSEEHKQAVSNAHKGKKQSPEQVEKRIKSRLATLAARKLNLANKGI